MRVILLILLVFTFSCDNIDISKKVSDNLKNDEKEKVMISIKDFYVYSLNYKRKSCNTDKETMFYYPSETYITFDIISNSIDSLVYHSTDSLPGSDKYDVFLTCTYKGEVKNIFTHHQNFDIYLLPGERSGIGGSIIDLPIFDSVYSNYEIEMFFKDFHKKAKFKVCFREPNGNITFFEANSDSIKIVFMIDETPLELSSVGYPDTITICDKLVIGPFIGW